jgi:hypothetical protein
MMRFFFSSPQNLCCFAKHRTKGGGAERERERDEIFFLKKEKIYELQKR